MLYGVIQRNNAIGFELGVQGAGKCLSNRCNWKRRIYIDGSLVGKVGVTIGLDVHNFAVFYDGDGDPRDMPIIHRVTDVPVEAVGLHQCRLLGKYRLNARYQECEGQ